MRAIYKQSKHTHLRVGPAFDRSDELMDWLSWEDRRLVDPGHGGGDDDWAAARYQREMADPKRKPIWEALLQLMQMSYWRRIWIVQEVAYGNDSIVNVGSKTVSFYALHRVLSSVGAEHASAAPGSYVPTLWRELM